MSYAVSQPQAKPRPAAVTYAVYLLWGVVAAQLLGVVLGVLPNEQRDRAVDEFRAAHPELGDTSGVEAATLVVGIVVAVIIAIGLAVLAYFVGRGSQPARVTTWVLAGLGVLCTGCGLLAAQATPSLLSGPDAEVQREYFEIMQANTPAWLTAASMAINVAVLLALIAVIILLATPAANDYFRKEQQVWVPPSDYSGGGWPGSTPPAPTST